MKLIFVFLLFVLTIPFTFAGIGGAIPVSFAEKPDPASLPEEAPRGWEQHNARGLKLFESSKYAEAEQAFREALKDAEALGIEGARLAKILHNLGGA
ncbi:MAG: hypothetical protein ACKV22_03830, partial [Bryobacteraceae bacterium]